MSALAELPGPQAGKSISRRADKLAGESAGKATSWRAYQLAGPLRPAASARPRPAASRPAGRAGPPPPQRHRTPPAPARAAASVRAVVFARLTASIRWCRHLLGPSAYWQSKVAQLQLSCCSHSVECRVWNSSILHHPFTARDRGGSPLLPPSSPVAEPTAESMQRAQYALPPSSPPPPCSSPDHSTPAACRWGGKAEGQSQTLKVVSVQAGRLAGWQGITLRRLLGPVKRR